MTYADDVLSVYETVLQREPTALELSNALSGPQDETSLSQLISTLSTSNEAEAFVWPVIRLYQGVYGRVPDADGLSFSA